MFTITSTSAHAAYKRSPRAREEQAQNPASAISTSKPHHWAVGPGRLESRGRVAILRNALPRAHVIVLLSLSLAGTGDKYLVYSSASASPTDGRSAICGLYIYISSASPPGVRFRSSHLLLVLACGLRVVSPLRRTTARTSLSPASRLLQRPRGRGWPFEDAMPSESVESQRRRIPEKREQQQLDICAPSDL